MKRGRAGAVDVERRSILFGCEDGIVGPLGTQQHLEEIL